MQLQACICACLAKNKLLPPLEPHTGVAGGAKEKGKGFVPPFVQKAMAGPEEQDGASKFSPKTLDLLAGACCSLAARQLHLQRFLKCFVYVRAP